MAYDTKHAIIEQYYIKKIETRSVLPGEQLPSEHEIAELFSVSRHTVRQALNVLAQEGWIYKERGVGSFFSEKAVDIRTGKSIAVLTTYLDDYIFPKIIGGIEHELRARGYNLLLFNSNNSITNEIECLNRIINNQDVVGVIIEPAQSAVNKLGEEFRAEFIKRNIKCLAINGSYQNFDSAYVQVDDEQGGYKLTRYLLELGHKRIAGLFKIDDRQGVKRKAGYIRALREIGIEPEINLIGEYVTDNQGVYMNDFIKKISAQLEKPTAILCYNDKIALRVIGELRAEEIQVPDEISVVSFDDSSAATSSDIKLTTIKHPKRDMGIRAAKCIVNMVEGRMDKPQYSYEAEMIVRESCKKAQ